MHMSKLSHYPSLTLRKYQHVSRNNTILHPTLLKPNFHGLPEHALEDLVGHIGEIRGTISCHGFTAPIL